MTSGPLLVLGRARVRTLRNVYGAEAPIVGQTSSIARLRFYVPTQK